VGDATPTLRLRNTTDPEDDPLHYSFVVRDSSGDPVTQSPPVPSGEEETSWTVTDPLAEDANFFWMAQASDGDLTGPWSAPAAFRVDVVQEPPSAPVPVLPADGAVVEETRPTLVVENAASPEGLALVYTFELYAVSGGVPTLLGEAHDVPEEPDTTAWTPSIDLSDGSYEWRARASDPVQDGPWSATSRFEVQLDPPPAAPTGLQATPGDGRVWLDWNASPEDDVTGYHVYRATTSGGPYDFVGTTVLPELDDGGLTNSVVYYYVVTALDARQESLPSQEAAARPEAPAVLVAEVRYEPSSLTAECLLARGGGHRAELRGDRSAALRPNVPNSVERARGNADPGQQCHWPPQPGPECPEWIYATVELPPGHAPESIDLLSLRLLGVASADPQYQEYVDIDGDGLTELRARFHLDDLAPLLSVGVNHVTLTGHAGASDLTGTNIIAVSALATDLRISPRTLNRRSNGNDILAELTFASGLPADQVDVSSIRLNDTVPAERILSSSGRKLHIKFDRAAVLGVLPTGESVEVRVTGTLHGLPFEGVDFIRVID
jgi:hypothetical protein